MDMNRNDIVRLGKDIVFNKVATDYSMEQAMDVMYNALVEANGGKKYLDPRDIRDGKCAELFAIIEEVIAAKKHDILENDEFFQRFVDYRNVAFGDKPEFYVPSNELFWVSEIGSGSQGLRRQRMIGGSTYTVTTKWRGIKIYEEIERMLAGRVDFAAMIDNVARSFAADTLERINTTLTGSITGLAAPYDVTGNFVEATMMNMIQHVKAANNSRNVYILGTMIGLNKVVASHETYNQAALSSKYNIGFAGYFNGTPKMEIMNMHKPGTDTFAISDNIVYVLAGDTKPIMYVTEGNSLILPHNFAENMDMTEEYLMMEKTGILALAPDGEGKFGRYNITA